MSDRRRQVSVIGASKGDADLLADAEAVGRGLAEAGLTIICGGMGGVMEAAARGASQSGGEVIGVIPWDDATHANRHVTHVIATGIGYARNLAVVASGEVVVAVGGAWGTLSEIAFARNLGRPVIALDSWEIARAGQELGIVSVEEPSEAVAAALEALQ